MVLTPDEVVRILGFLEGEHRLFAQLLYGTGMRISEGLQLRVKDLDFDHGTIIVREGKGSKDRALMLPESLAPSLREQLSRARAWWLKDQAEGRSGVALPDALDLARERQAHEAGARTRATAHERTPQQERQKAAREAERGREAWTLGQGMKKPVAGCYGRLTRWKGGGDVVYMALL